MKSYMVIDRDDYLEGLSRSDLSVEEKLAGGATVGDLISAGVLHDDYPAGCDFTEEAPEPQKYDGPPMSDEELSRDSKSGMGNSGSRLEKMLHLDQFDLRPENQFK